MSCSWWSADDHRAGAEEEQGLEEGVSHEVEDRRRPGADPEGEEHVADLADGGVGEHAFDVGLDQRAASREQQGRRTDDGDDGHGERRQHEDHVGAGDEIDTGGDHGRGVDQGADRGRAGHGVGQPGLERELGRLADSAAEKQQRHGYGHARSHLPVVQPPRPWPAGCRGCPRV